jgi:hypothetical protein
MVSLLRILLGTVVGVVLGGAVNVGIILAGSRLVPPPSGVDVNDPASINAHLGEYPPIQFAVPFLAHALGVAYLPMAWLGHRIVARPAARREQILHPFRGPVPCSPPSRSSCTCSFRSPSPLAPPLLTTVSRRGSESCATCGKST